MSSMLQDIRKLAEAYEQHIAKRTPIIGVNKNHSLATLEKVRQILATDQQGALDGVQAVAVAGSFARLEASVESDFDALVFATDKLKEPAVKQRFYQWFHERLKEAGIRDPQANPKGVFAEPIFGDEIRPVAGNSGESYATLSRRVLMVLESRCVFGEAEYDARLSDILEKYTDDVTRDSKKNFVFLLNDIIRYFRTICVNYQYTKSELEEWGKWPMRNIKLRHSRVLMYFSMIAAIGSLSKYDKGDKIGVLREFIGLEPLRRLYVVYNLHNDNGFYRLSQCYDVFLDRLSNTEVRESLRDLEYENRYSNRHFATLKSNSDALSHEFLRFYMARRRDWDERFFEYMIL